MLAPMERAPDSSQTLPTPTRLGPFWRNALFLSLCAAGLGAVGWAYLTADAMPASSLLSSLQSPKSPATAGVSDSSSPDLSAEGKAGSGEYPDLATTLRRVNAAFETQWTEAGLEPAPPAPSLTVARRLSLALTGTIPSLEEVRALEEIPEEERLTWWLDHLFQDRRHGDYLAERLARACVGVEDGPFIIYRRSRFVTWLSDQLMTNRPYDDLVRDLITSKGLWTSEPAVNFITVTANQAAVDAKKKGPDEVKLAARVTRAFLGLRIDCMECHDDKFGDRWKQEDFHQLAAFFAGTDLAPFVGVRDHDQNTYEFRFNGELKPRPVEAKVPFEPELLPADGPLRARLAAWVTAPENRSFARAAVNRVWTLLFNQPLVDPIDDIPLDGPWPGAMEVLADDFTAHGYDLRRLIRVIAASRPYLLDSRSLSDGPPVTDAHYQSFAAFPLTRLRPEQVAGSLLQASTLKTIDADSHILRRFMRYGQQNDFVKRFGDLGEDEFTDRGGTIPQRLLMMNGKVVDERTQENLVLNASTRLGLLSPTLEATVETAYLSIFTRRPTDAERDYFITQLQNVPENRRNRAMEDFYWVLMNATEFSWNH